MECLCNTCSNYFQCVVRLQIEGSNPCDGEGYEPYSYIGDK